MVSSDLPQITDSIRNDINDIIERRYEIIESDINKMLTYPQGNFVSDFLYHNIYQMGKNNIVYGHSDKPMMSLFDFDKRSKIRIMNILKIKEQNPDMNIVRVFPDTVVPFHLDLNKGSIGRDRPMISIVVNGGRDCMLYIGNKLDGNYQFALPGYSEFIMYPTQIIHGAKSGKLPYTLLQIHLDEV